MKKNYTLIFGLLFLLNAPVFGQQELVSTPDFLEELFNSGKTFEEITTEADAHFTALYPEYTNAELCLGEHRDGNFVKYQRWKSFWRHHVLPNGTLADLSRASGYQPNGSRSADCSDAVWDVTWNNINYTSNMGLQIDQGRTSSLAFHPTDEDTYFVGAAWGGLWKTTNGGLTYENLNDNLPLAAVCGIAIDPADPDHIAVALSDIVWYGPGALGVFVSTDGGATFEPTDISWSLPEGRKIYYMDQDPNDADNIIIATNVGLLRTTDFFESSEEVLSSNMRHVTFSQTTPGVVFAGGSGGQFFKSEDSGASFEIVTDFGSGHVRIAVPLVDGSERVVATHDGNLQTSTDNGETFTTHGLPESNMVVEFSTGSDEILNVGNFEVYRSNDFGLSFSAVSHWLGSGGLPFIHVDQRNVFVNPLEDNYVYFCNDGGIFRYDNETNSFANLSTDLIITQYYDIAVSQSEDLVLGGGSQDNGNIFRNAAGGWDRYAQTGDGMGQEIDPDDAETRYWSYQYGGLRRWQDGGNVGIAPPGEDGNGAWETPFKLDPNNSDRLFVGYSTVYVSDNQGDTWSAVGDPVTPGADMQQIAIAPSNSDKIYASHGRVLHVKEPGESEWIHINTPKFANITDLEVDPLDENKVYISYDGYIDDGKVYMSEDAGETWTDLSEGLPNLPIMSLELYENEAGGIFVGTYGAVYYRDDYLGEWRKYGCIPATSVTDIEIQYQTNKIFIGTHGRGMFEAPIMLYNASISEEGWDATSQLNLYPNPTTGLTYIQSPNTDLSAVEVTVMDLTGRIIDLDYSLESNGEIAIDCSEMVAGNYVIALRDQNDHTEVLRLSVF